MLTQNKSLSETLEKCLGFFLLLSFIYLLLRIQHPHFVAIEKQFGVEAKQERMQNDRKIFNGNKFPVKAEE